MFDINLQSLAEQVSANYFHFIADISDDRTFVRTMQSSHGLPRRRCSTQSSGLLSCEPCYTIHSEVLSMLAMSVNWQLR